MNIELIKYNTLAFIKNHFPILSGFYVNLFKVKSGLDFTYDRLIDNKNKSIHISTLEADDKSFNLFDVDIYLNDKLEIYFELLIPTNSLNTSLVDWDLNSYSEYILNNKIKLLPDVLLEELNDSYYNYKFSNIEVKVVSQIHSVKLPHILDENNIHIILNDLEFISENIIYDNINVKLLEIIESSKLTKDYFNYYGYSLTDYYTKEIYNTCVLYHLPIEKYLKNNSFVAYVKVNNYIIYSVITYDTTDLHKGCQFDESINIRNLRNTIEIELLHMYSDSNSKLIFLPQMFITCPLDFCLNTISMVIILNIARDSIFNFSRYSKQELEQLEETVPLFHYHTGSEGFTFVTYNYINKFKHLLPKE